MGKCIVLTCFDNCQGLNDMVSHVKKWLDLPIEIYDEERVNTYWKGNPRYGHRNSDLWRIRAMTELDYKEFLYLDLDMNIRSERITEGFELADKFDLCLPINPRSFVGIDSRYGADPCTYVGIYSATAYNMSPVFAKKTKRFLKWANAYIDEMMTKPARGPAVAFRASVKTSIFPYVLAPEWCSHEQKYAFEKPITEIIRHEN